MLEVVVSVIPQPGKGPAQCTSYRPISLLNVDAKIFSTILATRLHPLMQGLVDPDQTGFSPERKYGHSTKQILQILDKVP